MTKCAVLIPVYKFELTDEETLNVKISLKNLQGFDIYLIAPQRLNLENYNFLPDSIKVKRFEDFYFESISNYSKLMLSRELYLEFQVNYSHVLILQTDAIILKPELNYWIDQPFDYIGAPWKNGFQLQIKTKRFPIEEGVLCRAHVGNGGLSLRRINSCLNLFEEFSDSHSDWVHHGHAEDLFFSFLGSMSSFYVLPNILQAAKFSHETDADYFYTLIGNEYPFGVHGYDKYPIQYLKNYPEFK